MARGNRERETRRAQRVVEKDFFLQPTGDERPVPSFAQRIQPNRGSLFLPDSPAIPQPDNNETFIGRKEASGITLGTALEHAVWLEKVGEDHIVYVSIVDATSLVPRNSYADQRQKAFSGLTSVSRASLEYGLQEGKQKPTITISVPLEKGLVIGKPKIEKTYLTSQKGENNPILKDYTIVAQQLLERRKTRGSLALYDRERGVATTEEGIPRRISPGDAHLADFVEQEFLILADEAVAEYIASFGVPALFRNHIVRTFDPQQAIILRDIQFAISRTEPLYPNVLQAIIDSGLYKTTYGIKPEGHFGLHLPICLHCTSPLSNYADLVNQRILAALISSKEQFPYTGEQLATIAADMNNAERKQGGANLQGVIALTASGGDMPEEVEQTILVRLQEDTLTDAEIRQLLIESRASGQSWNRIKTAIAAWLPKNPGRAGSIMYSAVQRLNRGVPIQLVTQQQDDGKFITTATVRARGTEYTSGEIKGRSGKHSATLARLYLFANILGIPIASQQEREKNDQPPQKEQQPTKKGRKRKRASKHGPPKRDSLDEELDSQEPINQTAGDAIRFRVDGSRIEQVENDRGTLQNICRHNKSAEPTFELLSQEGSETTPTFTVRAMAIINGIVYESDPCTGNRIKTAQINAAQNVLKKLPSSLLEQENARNKRGKKTTRFVTVKVRDSNFIDVVQQVCQKKHWQLPTYTTNREKTGELMKEGMFNIFTCICAVTSPDGESISCTAQNPNVKIAKQRAAEQLFAALSRII